MKSTDLYSCLSPVFLCFSLFMFNPTYGNSQEDLFKDGKKACIDHKWDKAVERFEEFVDRYPESQLMDEVRFWLGYSLEKVPQRQMEAFNTFASLIENYPESPWLDNAMVHRIRLAEQFVNAGSEEYRTVLAEGLSNENKEVQYRAAISLGQLGDKQALPVLRQLQEDADLGRMAHALVTSLENTGDSLVTTPDSEVERPKNVGSIFASKRYKQYRPMLRKDDGWSKQELMVFGMWYILESDEFEEFNSLTDEFDRIQWYEDYWHRRADESDFNESELRTEFDRRVIFARTFFSDVSPHYDRKYRADQYLLSGEFRAPWDARGELYIKYGEPGSRNLAHWDGLDSEHWDYPDYEVDFIVYKYWTNIYREAIQNGPIYYGFHEQDRLRFERDFIEDVGFQYNTAYNKDAFSGLHVRLGRIEAEQKGDLLVRYSLDGAELNDVLIDNTRQHILFVNCSVLDEKHQEIVSSELKRAIMVKDGLDDTVEGMMILTLNPGKYIVRLRIQDFCSNKFGLFEQDVVIDN